MAGDNISYLKRMRSGDPPHVITTLGNGSESFDVAVILLSNDVMLNINEKVEDRYHSTVGEDGKVIKSGIENQKTRAMYYNRLLCYECMRVPGDITQRVADSADEIGRLLDDEDIKRVCEKYNELLVNKAPKLEVLSEEELDSLKKYLEVTPLRDISTVSLVHLKYCHQTLVSEQCLTNNGSGSLSIRE